MPQQASLAPGGLCTSHSHAYSPSYPPSDPLCVTRGLLSGCGASVPTQRQFWQLQHPSAGRNQGWATAARGADPGAPPGCWVPAAPHPPRHPEPPGRDRTGWHRGMPQQGAQGTEQQANVIFFQNRDGETYSLFVFCWEDCFEMCKSHTPLPVFCSELK